MTEKSKPTKIKAMYKVITLGDFLPMFNNMPNEEKRVKVIEHIYNNYKVVDKLEYKTDVRFVVEA